MIKGAEMTSETAPNSLREQLSNAFDSVTEAEQPAVTQTEPAVEATTETPAVEKQEKAEGRTAGRPRDAQGRLLPGKPEKAPQVTESAPVVEEKTEVKVSKPRPDSWKKEYWDYWEKIDPKLQEYLHEREGDFRKGVGTYKSEYDRLRPIDEAIKPYVQHWEQAGVTPDQALKNLAETDRILRYGSKEDKLRLMAYMAQSYAVPINEMLVRGEDGQVYFNQQYLNQQQQQPAQQGLTPQQVEQLVQEKMARAAWAQKVKDFRDSNPDLSPEVEKAMAGLLQAGLANDLPSALEAAMRLPQHAALFEARQTAKRQAEEAQRKQEAADKAARARAGAVSVKSQSPTGTAAGEKTRKGLRDTIAEAMDAVESGRV